MAWRRVRVRLKYTNGSGRAGVQTQKIRRESGFSSAIGARLKAELRILDFDPPHGDSVSATPRRLVKNQKSGQGFPFFPMLLLPLLFYCLLCWAACYCLLLVPDFQYGQSSFRRHLFCLFSRFQTHVKTLGHVASQWKNGHTYSKPINFAEFS